MRDSIASVTESILIGLALSVAVLIGFLKRWRTTLVAAVVIPVAILVTVVFLKLFDMSFNLMTLGGLAAAVGVVIDDAIVIVENIVLHLSLGQSPRDAAKSAIRELTPALIGSTLTPIVVFAPLVFLGGVTAVFFRALAFALVTALFASLFLAIFFTPVLARLILRPHAGPAETDLEKAEEAEAGPILRWFVARYERALHWCLAHSRSVLAGAALVLAGSVLLYLNLGSGFLPEMDEGAFVLDYITPAGTSLEETNRMLLEIERFLRETPEVESYSRRTGAQLGLVHRRAEHRGLPGEAQAETLALPRGGHDRAAPQDRPRPARRRRRVPPHPGGPDRRPGLFAPAHRGQDLQRRRRRPTSASPRRSRNGSPR